MAYGGMMPYRMKGECNMCPKCGWKIEETVDRFCRHCGEDLISMMSECSHCHAVVHFGDHPMRKGCGYCGNKWEPIHPASPSSYVKFAQEVLA